jgi:serine/threonine-protein kinase
VLYDEIAAGGMATVHFGRQSGAAGFSRTVAIKRLHANLAKDPEFVAMFLDEARLVARIRHPNVIPTIDVVATEGEVFVVMEYVHGESLARLRTTMLAAGRVADPRIVAAIMSGVLHGLHAAHEARSEQGKPLNIVHRDVSPQNILVGIEGISRVLDFGVAKAIGRVQSTREGQIKGKLGYMPPEQLQGGNVTRQADIYAAAAVTWEAMTGQRLFSNKDTGALVTAILTQPIRPPSEVASHVASAFDRVIMRGLERDPTRRYATARDMALDLERCAGVVSPSEVGTWVERWGGPALSRRSALIAEIEGSPSPPSEPTLGAPIAGVPPSPASGVAEVSSGQVSALSSLSHVTASSVARRLLQPGRRVAVFASIGGLALAVAVTVLVAFHARTEKGGVTAPAPRALVPANASAAAPIESASSGAPPAVDVASHPVATGLPDDKKPRPVVSAAPHPQRPPMAATSKPAKPDCATPFVVDDKGHKHYKPECL